MVGSPKILWTTTRYYPHGYVWILGASWDLKHAMYTLVVEELNDPWVTCMIDDVEITIGSPVHCPESARWAPPRSITPERAEWNAEVHRIIRNKLPVVLDTVRQVMHSNGYVRIRTGMGKRVRVRMST